MIVIVVKKKKFFFNKSVWGESTIKGVWAEDSLLTLLINAHCFCGNRTSKPFEVFGRIELAMEHCWKVHVENNELMLDLGHRCLEGVVVVLGEGGGGVRWGLLQNRNCCSDLTFSLLYTERIKKNKKIKSFFYKRKKMR